MINKFPEECSPDYKGRIWFETDLYRVVTGVDLDARGQRVDLYNTFNKQSGVVEIQTRCLPESLQLTYKYQTEYDAILTQIKNDVGIAKKGNIIVNSDDSKETNNSPN